MNYNTLFIKTVRPFGRTLRNLNPKAYAVARWKMRELMGNPMSQHFLLPFIVHSGDTVIDIGANTGQLTLPLARLVGQAGIVYAFEPIKKTFSELKENIKSEGLFSRVILNQVGLSDSSGYTTFTIPQGRYTEATLQPHYTEGWANYENEKEKFDTELCEITTLDNFVKENNIGNITFIKCDVEGGELQVFKGAIDILQGPSPPIIILEAFEGWTKDFGYHPRDLFKFLKNIADYDFYWVYKEGLKRVEPDDEIIPGIFYEWIDFLCVIPHIHNKRLNVARFLA